MSLDQLPALNAALNSVCLCLLLAGWLAIRAERAKLHRAIMIGALTVSVAFLASYLTYHYHHGSTRFTAQGPARVIYFVILISHTILAAVNLPLVIVAVVRAAKGQFEKHRRLARITLPIWAYVSATGVLVYLMLYRLYPPTSP